MWSVFTTFVQMGSMTRSLGQPNGKLLNDSLQPMLEMLPNMVSSILTQTSTESVLMGSLGQNLSH